MTYRAPYYSIIATRPWLSRKIRLLMNSSEGGITFSGNDFDLFLQLRVFVIKIAEEHMLE